MFGEADASVQQDHSREAASIVRTRQEAKQGRILSISEELIAFDQTGEINRRARALGFYLRQERERTIVRAVTDLGRRLGLTTTAEGIETEAQRDRARGLGCTAAQGFLFGEPMPAQEAAALITRHGRQG